MPPPKKKPIVFPKTPDHPQCGLQLGVLANPCLREPHRHNMAYLEAKGLSKSVTTRVITGATPLRLLVALVYYVPWASKYYNWYPYSVRIEPTGLLQQATALQVQTHASDQQARPSNFP